MIRFLDPTQVDLLLVPQGDVNWQRARALLTEVYEPRLLSVQAVDAVSVLSVAFQAPVVEPASVRGTWDKTFPSSERTLANFDLAGLTQTSWIDMVLETTVAVRVSATSALLDAIASEDGARRHGATRPDRPRQRRRRLLTGQVAVRWRHHGPGGDAMRVMIIDDSVIAREGLRRLLESEGHQVLATLGRIDRVPDAVERGRPDAVILDIRMPPTFTDEGVQLGIELRVAWPELAILVLSQYAVPEYATRLLERGASGTGYLPKDRIFEPMQLSQALQRLGEGGTVVDPDVVGELIAARRNSEVLSCLTSKEREVLKLMAEGLSNKGIAERMFVSLDTVGSHVQPFSASSGHPLRRRQPAGPRRSLVPARSLVRPPRSSKSATDITVSGDSRDRAPQLRSCLADREDTGDKTVVIAANPCIGFPRILTPTNLSSE